MNVITSRDNNLYKKTLKLLRKKSRDETGQYLLEGLKPLRDALEMGLMIEKIFACEGTELPEWIPQEKCVILKRRLFEELSDTVTSQGILAAVRKPQTDLRSFSEHVDGNIVILDRIQDPGNAGTIIRTAEAAGFGGILALQGTADLYAPKTVRSAAGSLMRMPVLTDVSRDDAVRLARETGRKLVVSALEHAVSCFEHPMPEHAMLVIGNEGGGVCEELLEAADLRVKIPMEGSIESLNAAVAAGILMYQIVQCADGREDAI